MNLNDLAKLDIKDLKNIDYGALIAEFKKKPDIVIATLCILATLASCLYFYGLKKEEFSSLAKQVAELEEKSSVYTEFMQAQSALKSLKTSLPKTISESMLIELITLAAKKYNINISSFSPASIEKQSTYSTLTVTLDINAATYGNLWSFISELENKHKTLRLDSWSLNIQENAPMQNRRQPQTQQQNEKSLKESKNLKSTLILTIVNFNHD